MGAEIQMMIDGVVLLNIPDEFAWSLYLEGKDADRFGELAATLLNCV